MATVRSRRASRAQYTSPIPPVPSGDRISYGPIREPTLRAIRITEVYASSPGDPARRSNRASDAAKKMLGLPQRSCDEC